MTRLGDIKASALSLLPPHVQIAIQAAEQRLAQQQARPPKGRREDED